VWLAERLDVSRPLSLDGARWIWHTSGKDIPLEETAAGTCCFRSELTVPEGAVVKTARAVVTADDRFVLYVNGARVGTSDGAQIDWRTPETIDLTAGIRTGRNVIAVEAENTTPSPAGLIAKFVVTPEKGDPIVRVTGPDWKCAAQAGGEWYGAAFDDSNWANAKAVGAFGCAPWGAVSASE
jgi:alpha-L-rhamnosidase